MTGPDPQVIAGGHGHLRRFGIVAIALVTALLSLRVAIGFVIGPVAPDVAMQLGAAIAPTLTAHVNHGLSTTTVDHADGLIAEARRAMVAAPFDTEAVRVVGLTEAARGNVDYADRLLSRAGAMNKRDYLTHAWLADRRFKQHDVAGAIDEVDITLLQSDISWPVMLPQLVKLLPDPRVVAPLVERLRRKPVYRGTFLVTAATTPGDLMPLYRLLAALTHTDAPPTADERNAYLANAYGKVDNIVLRDQWRSLDPGSPEPRRATRAFDFEATAAPVPFGWRFGGTDSSYGARDTAPGRTGHALLVTASGPTVGGFASRLAFLDPGTYRWSVDVYAEDARSVPSPFAWHVRCTPRGDRGIDTGTVAVPALRGSWQRLTTTLTIPRGCRAQLVALDGADTRVAGDQRTWFDAMRFDRVER